MMISFNKTFLFFDRILSIKAYDLACCSKDASLAMEPDPILKELRIKYLKNLVQQAVITLLVGDCVETPNAGL